MSTKRETKRSTKKVAKEEVVQEPVVVQEEHEEHEETEPKTRGRRTVTKDSLIASIQELNAQLDAELSAEKKQQVGNRFVRRVRKALRMIESDAKRVLKIKSGNRKASATSGFMKPVMISEEMARFTGLDKNGSFPRPTITKFVCEYIKKNNLQNPEDKREFRVDSPLQKLLKYDPKNPPKDESGATIPMTYFRLQKYMQHHFRQTQQTPVVATSVPVPAPAVQEAQKPSRSQKKQVSK